MTTLSIPKADPSVIQSKNTLAIPYFSLRNISSPDDTENKRKILSGHMSAKFIMGLPTHENVREYLLDQGKKRKVPTAVHRAIKSTIQNNPEKFSVLNGGITIVASSFETDEKTRIMTLKNPSIINGAQTQGILKDYYNSLKEPEIDFPEMHITYELIITTDESLIAEISIARNFQNDVKLLSISGKLKILDDIADAIEKGLPGQKLRRSETDNADEYIDTEKLLQVITALTPEDLWTRLGRGEMSNKVYAYNQKAKCLKQFIDLKNRVDKNPDDELSAVVYRFYIDIACEAWTLYKKWKIHTGFRGTAIRSIEREAGKIVDIPDGIIFPILASLALFISEKNGVWKLNIPEVFRDEDLIQAAKSTYQEIAGHKPYVMGRSKASYSSLVQVTAIYNRLIANQ